MKEIELYPLIKEFLETLGYTVYGEVPLKGSNRYIDVVGINYATKKTIGIELKTKKNQDIHLQGQFNSCLFDLSFIAIPKPKNKKNPLVSNFFGLIYVDIENNQIELVNEPLESPKFKYSFENLMERLFINDINKEIQGGSEITKNGLTAYKTSINNVIDYLQKHGPSTLDQIIENTNLHWTHPKANLKQAILHREFDKIGIDSSKKPVLFFIK